MEFELNVNPPAYVAIGDEENIVVLILDNEEEIADCDVKEFAYEEGLECENPVQYSEARSKLISRLRNKQKAA